MKTKTVILAAALLAALLVIPFALTSPSANATPELHSFRDLVVHEWGTFTSVAGSDGTLLPGLEREEESLPAFVYSHHGMGPRGSKGFLLQRPIHNATIKLETPVLYFYHQDPLDLTVKVRFNGGSISQWFPQRAGGETVPPVSIADPDPKSGAPARITGALDFGEKPYQGAIAWNIRSLGRGQGTNASVLKYGETLNWIRPRWPESNILENRAENATHEKEKYLFYRGVGNFPLPLSTRFDPNNPNTLILQADTDIPFALVYHMDKNYRSTILWKGAVNFETPQAHIHIPTNTAEYRPLNEIADSAFIPLKTALVDAGLTDVEADSMLRTWWSSYFQKPGLRVFWIVPRPFTDDILPIDISPHPAQVERVLVGRSEVLSPAFEKELLTEFTREDQNENPYRHHPLAKAFQSRVTALK
jgi:hypothetical protein